MSPTQSAPEVLGRLLDPVGRLMPPGYARELAALRAAPEDQERGDQLAARSSDGTLTDEERAEYEAYVDAIDVVGLLQSQARAALARHESG